MDPKSETEISGRHGGARPKNTKKNLEGWKKILVRTGQTLTLAARSITGMRFQEADEEPRHTAMTFKVRVEEVRKGKLARKINKQRRERSSARKRKTD